MSTWFNHCDGNWAKWIKEDAKKGGPLQGSIGKLRGDPGEDSELWRQWLLMAGDDDGADPLDDMEFDGDGGDDGIHNNQDEEELLRQGLPTGDSDEL